MKTTYAKAFRAAVIATRVAGIGFALVFCASCSRNAGDPPPPLQTDVVVVAPSPDYVWVGGYWGWSWWHYTWIPGRWTMPPHPHAVWETPRWDRDGDHYHFAPGRWR